MARRKSVVKPSTQGDGPVCPKCAGNKRDWIGPVYVATEATWHTNRSQIDKVTVDVLHAAEHLRYTCPNCGYTRKEPTKDCTQTA